MIGQGKLKRLKDCKDSLWSTVIDEIKVDGINQKIMINTRMFEEGVVTKHQFIILKQKS